MWEVVGLPLPPALRQALVDGGFTAAEELGRAGPVALAQEAGVSQEDALYACKVAAECMGRSGREGGGLPIATAASLLERGARETIATRAGPLDAALRGGVPQGVITELCGVPGAGKTQLAMQLAVNVQLPRSMGGLDGRALYLDTEGSFTPERVQAMAEAALEEAPQSSGLTTESLLGGVSYQRIHSALEQLNVVESLPGLCRQDPRLRLVVLDSLVFHLRHTQGEGSLRRHALMTMYQMLSCVARECNVAVLVVNQFTTRLGKDGPRLVPVSGETWGHIPTVRLFAMSGEAGNYLQVNKSPWHPQEVAFFRITGKGIEPM